MKKQKRTKQEKELLRILKEQETLINQFRKDLVIDQYEQQKELVIGQFNLKYGDSGVGLNEIQPRSGANHAPRKFKLGGKAKKRKKKTKKYQTAGVVGTLPQYNPVGLNIPGNIAGQGQQSGNFLSQGPGGYSPLLPSQGQLQAMQQAQLEQQLGIQSRLQAGGGVGSNLADTVAALRARVLAARGQEGLGAETSAGLGKALKKRKDRDNRQRKVDEHLTEQELLEQEELYRRQLQGMGTAVPVVALQQGGPLGAVLAANGVSPQGPRPVGPNPGFSPAPPRLPNTRTPIRPNGLLGGVESVVVPGTNITFGLPELDGITTLMTKIPGLNAVLESPIAEARIVIDKDDVTGSRQKGKRKSGNSKRRKRRVGRKGKCKITPFSGKNETYKNNLS